MEYVLCHQEDVNTYLHVVIMPGHKIRVKPVWVATIVLILKVVIKAGNLYNLSHVHYLTNTNHTTVKQSRKLNGESSKADRGHHSQILQGSVLKNKVAKCYFSGQLEVHERLLHNK